MGRLAKNRTQDRLQMLDKVIVRADRTFIALHKAAVFPAVDRASTTQSLRVVASPCVAMSRVPVRWTQHRGPLWPGLKVEAAPF